MACATLGSYRTVRSILTTNIFELKAKGRFGYQTEALLVFGAIKMNDKSRISFQLISEAFLYIIESYSAVLTSVLLPPEHGV